MRAHFRVGEPAYRWSTQDNHTVDRLPYVGPADDVEGPFVATGFAAWGMTNGTIAGLTIAEAILGHEPPWTELFALDRGKLRKAARRLLGENLNVAAQQLRGPFRSEDRDPGEIETGHGAVLSIDGDDVAVSRDARGDCTPSPPSAPTWAVSSRGTRPSRAGIARATARGSHPPGKCSTGLR